MTALLHPAFDIVKAILESRDELMPGQRYQDPKIEISTGRRPYYFIRAYVAVPGFNGIEPVRKSFPLGFLDETSKRQAAAEKQKLLEPINNRRFLLQSQLKFGEILDRYIALEIPHLGPAAQLAYQRHIRLHVRPVFGSLRMCDIDRLTVKTWLVKKEGEGYSHNTLLDLRKVLSAVFTAAIDDWQLWQGNNPCARLKVGGPRDVMPKTLPQRDGLLRFLGAIEDTAIISAEGARLIVMTAIATGMRISEVLGLQPRDIHLPKETVQIERSWGRGHLNPTKTPKSRRTRQIPGLASALLAFSKGKRENEFLFAREDGFPPDDRDLQQHVFRPAAERVGIYTRGFGMHRLRHLHITWRQQVGGTPLEVMKGAGHTNLDMTLLYTQTEVEREREQVVKILERIAPEGSVQ